MPPTSWPTAHGPRPSFPGSPFALPPLQLSDGSKDHVDGVISAIAAGEPPFKMAWCMTPWQRYQVCFPCPLGLAVGTGGKWGWPTAGSSMARGTPRPFLPSSLALHLLPGAAGMPHRASRDTLCHAGLSMMCHSSMYLAGGRGCDAPHGGARWLVPPPKPPPPLPRNCTGGGAWLMPPATAACCCCCPPRIARSTSAPGQVGGPGRLRGATDLHRAFQHGLWALPSAARAVAGV